MKLGRGTRWIAAIVLFAAAFAIALAVLAPASLIGLAIERATEGRLSVVGTEGRLWSGRGTLLARADGATLPLAWEIDPYRLLRAELKGMITPGAAEPVELALRRGRVEVGRFDIAAPVALVAVAAGAYGGYRIGGTARARSAGVAFEDAAGSGRVALRWSDASTGLIAIAPLGSYGVDLDMNGQSGSISVRTLEGALRIDGSGRWSRGGAVLSITARPSGERTETLRAWLRTMTPELPDGTFRFAWPQPDTRQRGASN